MIVYLDNSVLNRPFDDQKQPRIWLETLALSIILQMVEAKEVSLVRSAFHQLENEQNPFPLRRHWVEKCILLAEMDAKLDDTVRNRAQELERIGVKPLDSLHAASAEQAKATHFLTCDDRLVRRTRAQCPS